MPAPLTHDPSETDIAMMRRALLAAEEAAEKGEVPVGAVVARGGEPLAVAANEREATGDPTAHAELLAIRRSSAATGGWRLTGCTLYAAPPPQPPPPTPASIIPLSWKAAFSKKKQPHCSATSSTIVAEDPEKPPNALSFEAYNILKLEVDSARRSSLSLNWYYKDISRP